MLRNDLLLIYSLHIQDSVTTTKGLDVVPSNKEALHLLEERKKFYIPHETNRVIPPKKKEEKEKEEKENKEKKKRKRDSSSAETAAKKASAKTVRTALPLVIRSVEREV